MMMRHIVYEQTRHCLSTCGLYTIEPWEGAGFDSFEDAQAAGRVEFLKRLAREWQIGGPDDQLHYPLGVTIWDDDAIVTYAFVWEGGPVMTFRRQQLREISY